VLPIAQVLIAGFLLYLGDLQDANFPETSFAGGLAGWNVRAVWDYTPPAHNLFFCIDFPAVVLAAPILALMPEKGPLSRALLVMVVFLFWWWIGSGLDRRTGNLPPKVLRATRLRVGAWALGFLVSAGFAAVGISVLLHPGAMAILVPIAIVAWALFFMWHFGWKVWKHRESNPRQTAVR